ncbi:MAG: hypothetical protein WD691_06585 [Acidimicrobiales bacterium]
MTGAVYDRGYRPYEGTRGGRSAARTALLRSSIRRALGIRREWRQKVAPFALLGIAVVPAIVNVGVQYLTRNTAARDIEFLSYRDYVGVSNSLLVFVALTAPDILCPDRRQRVLPLIFARPLTGVDYVVAKVGTMASIVFAFSVIPQVILFVGQMLVSDDGSLRYLQDNADVLWRVPVAAGLLALFYATIGATIASLTSRRIIAGASIIGLFLITSAVSSILVGPRTDGGFQGEPPVVSTEVPASPFAPALPVEERTGRLVTSKSEPSGAPLLNLAGLPLVLRDVVFLGEVDPGHPMSGLANGGLLAGGVYVLVVGAGIGTLVLRYREVER